MTVKEFMALPDNGMRRWLVDGVLKEWATPGAALEPPRSLRGRASASVLVCAVTELNRWADAQPEPRGKVLAGDAGFVLERDPLTLACLDLAFVAADVFARPCEAELIDGVPLLAVEIIALQDTIGGLNDRLDVLERVGVPLVWIIDTAIETVTIHERKMHPRMVAMGDELACEPHLPGFRVPVARLFS